MPPFVRMAFDIFKLQPPDSLDFWYNTLSMKHLVAIFVVLSLCAGAEGSWYWPFSSDEDKPPRVSELMEPASIIIDDAYDLAAQGKTEEAVAKFREALVELDRVEAENPERVKEPEFNTIKNKRATVAAAIDSLLLDEAQSNAKAIAVTDTTELQKRYDANNGIKPAPEEPKKVGPKVVDEPVAAAEEAVAAEPRTPLELARKRNIFKLFANDVGLLASMYMNGIQLKLLNNDVDMNIGAIYENVVAQELKAH
ncbi:MAG: DUF4143 domain-containing protein, partial [Kiritimatiellae bacterium]|nr:DUF4143 domain-containing protein [Kiritimatiellia bacterium]